MGTPSGPLLKPAGSLQEAWPGHDCGGLGLRSRGGQQAATSAFAFTLETVSSAVWLRTCSTVALKLSTLINHPGFKQALVAGNFSELPHTRMPSAAWLCRAVDGVESE